MPYEGPWSDVEAARRVAVVVRPAAAEAFDHEDFGSLVCEVIQHTDLPADRVDVRLGYMYGDAGPPDWTVVSVILDEAGRAVLQSVVDSVIAWGKAWLRKKRKREPETKPILTVIYGPDGKVLREVPVPDEDPG